MRSPHHLPPRKGPPDQPVAQDPHQDIPASAATPTKSRLDGRTLNGAIGELALKTGGATAGAARAEQAKAPAARAAFSTGVGVFQIAPGLGREAPPECSHAKMPYRC